MVKYTKEQKEKIKRIKKSIERLTRAHRNLIKQKARRILIEEDKSINLFNYPLKRILKRKRLKEIEKSLE